jgi:hypothetical protein
MAPDLDDGMVIKLAFKCCDISHACKSTEVSARSRRVTY